MLTTFGNFGVTVGQIEDNISKYMKFLGKGVGGRGERYSCTLCGNQGTKTEITLHLHENHVDSLHQCKTCGENFKRAGLLRESKQKLFVCCVRNYLTNLSCFQPHLFPPSAPILMF